MDICVLSVWELKITACAQANIPRLLVMHMHIYIYIYIYIYFCPNAWADQRIRQESKSVIAEWITSYPP